MFRHHLWTLADDVFSFKPRFCVIDGSTADDSGRFTEIERIFNKRKIEASFFSWAENTSPSTFIALVSVFQLQPLTRSISTHALPASCLLDAPGTIEIPVLRHGSDLSSLTSVWCATRPSDPPSASPGVDYIPSSKKVEFKPGKTEEVRAEKCFRFCMQAASLSIAGFAAMTDTKRHKRQNKTCFKTRFYSYHTHSLTF